MFPASYTLGSDASGREIVHASDSFGLVAVLGRSGGVPCVWNVEMVWSPQAWPFFRSFSVQVIVFQSGASTSRALGIGHLDPVPAGLEHVEEEGLLHGMLVRPGFDRHTGFEEDVGRAQDLLAAIEREGDVVEAAGDAVGFLGEGEVVALVVRRQPHAGFLAGVEFDPLRAAQAQIALEELAAGADIDGQAVEVIDAADVDATGGKALRLVLQRRAELGGRLIPLGVVIELEDVAVGVAEAEAGLVPS